MLLSVNKVICGQGVVEEQVSGLAVNFQYLARVLDTCGKHCPKMIIMSDNCSYQTLVLLVEYH